MAVIEARIAMSVAIRKAHMEAGLTQAELAKRIGSSQARIAKMEGGDPQASPESMFLALGATATTRAFAEHVIEPLRSK